MGNILEYLDWRGDVPFSYDPFNEVDNLILAQTAYTRLDGMMQPDEWITPTEASRRFFGRYSHEEVAKDKPLHKDAPFLMEKLAHSKRYAGLRISHYVNEIDVDGAAQMSAMTFSLPDFTYVAFRGTDDSLAGWKEDFNLSYMNETEGQRMALDYLNDRLSEIDGTIYVGGHSKGGNFSVYASAFCDPSLRDKVTAVFSNDGPGFRQEVVETPEYNALLPKVTSILPESTLVGMLFSGRYDHKFVKSSLKGLAQHDATSWEVMFNRFVEASDLTPEGRRMDEAVAKWLSGLTDQDRVLFTDVTFDILSASGATSTSDLSGGAAGILDLLKNSRDIPKDKRKEFNGMLLQLFRIGGSAIFNNL